MATAYIQNIYNNSSTTFYMWAQDSQHLGVFTDTATGKQVGNNDNGNILTMPSGARYKGDWAGIPWYNGSTSGPSAHFRAISSSNNKSRTCLYMIQSKIGDSDGISFYNSGTGVMEARQEWGATGAGDKFSFSLIFTSTDQDGITMQMDNTSKNILYYLHGVAVAEVKMAKALFQIASNLAVVV